MDTTAAVQYAVTFYDDQGVGYRSSEQFYEYEDALRFVQKSEYQEEYQYTDENGQVATATRRRYRSAEYGQDFYSYSIDAA